VTRRNIAAALRQGLHDLDLCSAWHELKESQMENASKIESFDAELANFLHAMAVKDLNNRLQLWRSPQWATQREEIQAKGVLDSTALRDWARNLLSELARHRGPERIEMLSSDMTS
jgi:hypothetical protein